MYTGNVDALMPQETHVNTKSSNQHRFGTKNCKSCFPCVSNQDREIADQIKVESRVNSHKGEGRHKATTKAIALEEDSMEPASL